MATRNTNKDEIVISKRKLVKILSITFASLLFIVLCFFISDANSEEYQKVSNETTQQESSQTEAEDNFQKALKQAGEVEEDKRKAPNEISIDKYLELYKGNENSIILLSRPTCQYCKIATPILENIIYEKDILINYLNTDNLDNDQTAKLVSSDEYFSDGFGTPLIVIVGNGKMIDSIEGLTTKENYISFFKKNKFMED